MSELAAKYRERRDGGEGGVVGEVSTNAYRAVAPNAGETYDAAERRRQIIHESKYGVDMEHTHLVKGLDFALLQKVKELRSWYKWLMLTIPSCTPVPHPGPVVQDTDSCSHQWDVWSCDYGCAVHS